MTGPIEDEDWEGLGPSVTDRRQRAREAYHDKLSTINTVTGMPAIEEAIETATRVKITHDIIAAARAAFEDSYGGSVVPIIEAAFRAAGFEVEK